MQLDTKQGNLDSAELYAACRSADANEQQYAYSRLWSYLYAIAQYLAYDLPDTEAAQDCAQQALIRIHRRINECESPGTFLGWTRRIVKNLVYDEYRRQKRLVRLDEDDENGGETLLTQSDPPDSVEEKVITNWSAAELRQLIESTPLISDYSRRVVCGRYFDDLRDETIAQSESALSGKPVRPANIQVARTKNLAKLRKGLN
jgi:RNA polymerase sigma factor (sigma-70 family)